MNISKQGKRKTVLLEYAGDRAQQRCQWHLVRSGQEFCLKNAHRIPSTSSSPRGERQQRGWGDLNLQLDSVTTVKGEEWGDVTGKQYCFHFK